MSERKLLSIVTPCFNEEENVSGLFDQVREVIESQMSEFDFEYIFIDNDSNDNTVDILKAMAEKDKRIKIIVNSRNFGHIRSPFYALLQSQGDCSLLMAADFQDPPSLIPDFVKKWEEGKDIVVAVKNKSEETPLMFMIRSAYYNLVNRLSEIKLKKNYTGFGLYDKKIIKILRELKDPYPYFRGVIFELGFETDVIYFTQPQRKRGITKNNFFTLYDIAMLGICSHSKVPLRIATVTGFSLSILSLMIACGYFIAKLILWDTFVMGMAPIIIGIFFFASIQLFFLGIIGEYIGFIYTKVTNRPLVHEKERVNF
jgi:polyisoprenyl-phosphate glycosyltransferase